MMFYITFFYHPKNLETGKISFDEEESYVKKLNFKYTDGEEDDLRSVADLILVQLARRDRYVFDVKVEQTKKVDISYKESADGKGILLKGRKYSLHTGGELVVEESNNTTPATPSADKPAMSQSIAKTSTDLSKAFFQATFTPAGKPEEVLGRYHLTLEKTYTIENTSKLDPNDITQQYHLKDDRGRDITISEIHFLVEEPQNSRSDLRFLSDDPVTSRNFEETSSIEDGTYLDQVSNDSSQELILL